MAHFALLDENNVVVTVLCGRQEDDGQEEALFARTGQVYRQTSYNTRGGVYYDPETGEPAKDQSKSFRKNYAAIGFTYDEKRDAFIPPKLYESWVLDEDSCQWVPPFEAPNNGQYYWNETEKNWKKLDNLEGVV